MSNRRHQTITKVWLRILLMMLLTSCSKEMVCNNLGGIFSSQILLDFGGFYRSQGSYWQFAPSSVQEVAHLVNCAYKNKIPIRIRGLAHSQNGSTLPKKDEFLILTHQLNKVRWISPYLMEAEAGVSLGSLKKFLNQRGLDIPVINDGPSGPSLGGFISAGGISKNSEKFGGFWENVQSLTLVSSYGKIMQIDRESPLFKWLFGSMGQLGVITSAKINIFPLNMRFTTFKDQPLKNNDFLAGKIYWFNLFIPKDKIKASRNDLEEIKRKYPEISVLFIDYMYKISYKNINPPLVYGQNDSFFNQGIYIFSGENFPSKDLIKKVNQDFTQLASIKKYKRYYQAELNSGAMEAKNYFGENLLEDFKKVKQAVDPLFLFNQGSIFLDK